MKKIMLIPVALAIYITSPGQTATTGFSSGKIRYEEKMKIEIKLDGEAAQFADQLPKERTEQKILCITPEASLYQNAKETKNDDDATEMESGGTMVQMKVVGTDDKVYRDLKTNKTIEQRDFMSRMFLVESDGGKQDWKITGEQKTILNHRCQEATRESDGKKIKAWFTPEIPISTGPGNLGNLPGLILAVDINDGQRTLMATSIEQGPIDKGLIVKPREGKKVSEEQFKKIVAEKMKEMGAEGNGSGQHMIIRIQR